MTDNRIEAWLRLRDVARFKSDAKGAAREIDNIGDAGERLDGSFTDVNGRLRDVQGRFLEMGGSGGSVSSVARSFGFLRGVTGVLLIGLAVLSPVIVGLGGALVALAGSAAAAVGGLGVLATGGIGVLAAGLSGFGILLGSTIGNIGKINDAFAAYDLAVAQYGRTSDEAAAAQERLAAVVEQFGGPRLLAVVERFRKLGQTWRRLTAPAMELLIGLFGSVTAAAERMMPAFAAVTNTATAALAGPLTDTIRRLSGPEMQGILRSLGAAFAQVAGPLARTFGNVLMGLARSAQVAAPFFVSLMKAIERMTLSFANWAAGGGPAELFATLVRHTKSWWGLIKAVGGLLIAVLGGGAEHGRGLVDSLTSIINKWTAWLNTAEGQESLKRFFTDAIALTKAFLSTLVPLLVILFKMAREAMPTFTAAFRILGAILGPIAGVIGKIARIQAEYLAPAMLGVNLPLRAMKGLFTWFRDNAPAIWGTVKNAVGSAIRWMADRFRDFLGFLDRVKDKILSIPGVKQALKIGGGILKFGGGIVGAAGGLVKKLPGLAGGGLVSAGGLAVVGENGPELAALPGGSAVIPMSPAIAQPLPSNAALRGQSRTIITKVYLGARQIAEAIGEDIEDQMARA